MDDLERGAVMCVNAGGLPWRASTVAGGVFVKDIAVTDGWGMQVVRLEPGARFPRHTHEWPEFVYGTPLLGDGGQDLMQLQDMYAVIVTPHHKACRDFYARWLDAAVVFEASWFASAASRCGIPPGAGSTSWSRPSRRRDSGIRMSRSARRG